jgi:hypothetical protein
MPTIDIQLSDVRRKQNNVTFVATDTASNKVIERTININEINDWNTFAQWLLEQTADFELLPDKNKQLAITFHTEIFTDPETGEQSTIRVLDSVVVT